MKTFLTYEERNQGLARLGFPDYKTYLESPLWGIIRSEVMRRDRYVCRVCKRNPYFATHHLRHTRGCFLGFDSARLITICLDCHNLCEYLPDGQKRNLDEVWEFTANLLYGGRPKHNWWRSISRLSDSTSLRTILRIREEIPKWYKPHKYEYERVLKNLRKRFHE